MKSEKVKILRLWVSNFSKDELIDALMRFSESSGLSIVHYANAHGCNLSVHHDAFRRAMEAADCIFCDGNGVKFASVILGTPLKERMTPPDWIDQLFQVGLKEDKRFYFIGETEETMGRFVSEVKKSHPGLRIVGCHHGFFDFESSAEQALIEDLKRSEPDFILTGMGMPKQEIWAERMKGVLQHGVVLSTGALFLWRAGVEQRKQSVLTNHGFEWLVRYLKHPVRHFRRYIIGNPLFLLRVFAQRFRRDIFGEQE